MAGAGGRCVRFSGRTFEALSAARARPGRRDLYHSALQVRLDDELFVLEMAPVWQTGDSGRGVVCEGAVGLRPLGRSAPRPPASPSPSSWSSAAAPDGDL